MSEEISFEDNWKLGDNTFYYCVPNEPIFKVHPMRKEDNLMGSIQRQVMLCLYFYEGEVKFTDIRFSTLYVVPDRLYNLRNKPTFSYYTNMASSMSLAEFDYRLETTRNYYNSVEGNKLV